MNLLLFLYSRLSLMILVVAEVFVFDKEQLCCKNGQSVFMFTLKLPF